MCTAPHSNARPATTVAHWTASEFTACFRLGFQPIPRPSSNPECKPYAWAITTNGPDEVQQPSPTIEKGLSAPAARRREHQKPTPPAPRERENGKRTTSSNRVCRRWRGTSWCPTPRPPGPRPPAPPRRAPPSPRPGSSAACKAWPFPAGAKHRALAELGAYSYLLVLTRPSVCRWLAGVRSSSRSTLAPAATPGTARSRATRCALLSLRVRVVLS